MKLYANNLKPRFLMHAIYNLNACDHNLLRENGDFYKGDQRLTCRISNPDVIGLRGQEDMMRLKVHQRGKGSKMGVGWK